MPIDQATEINVLRIDGVAALVKPLDGTDGLRVFLLRDTFDVWMAVLKTIGDAIPADKVLFQPQKIEEQCSFCGKPKKEVLLLVVSKTHFCEGKKMASPICICNECVAHYAQLISDAKDISR
ncbi:MAG: hypothetical protein G01um101413_265 [Parcubacteria group bacterium Gr01-1014_13]|nr:MAG: hypothetical protein G01um101413_265 [Parcubacteria group bacterium Gr01-1014_13]